MQIQFNCIYIVTILIGSRCSTEHHSLTTKQATASKKSSLLTGRNLEQDQILMGWTLVPMRVKAEEMGRRPHKELWWYT